MLTDELVARVRRIELTTRKLVSDGFAGEYHSVYKGRGMEFDEVRQYVPGDDVRSIDWNVTARTGQPHVKRYVEERELAVMLAVDVSGSGDFGTRERFKRTWLWNSRQSSLSPPLQTTTGSACCCSRIEWSC